MQEIYTDDIGSGFPLILVHGYLGSSEMWKFQKEFFSKYFRVIAPALPGFGESYKVKSLDSINAMAKNIFDCIEETAKGGPILVDALAYLDCVVKQRLETTDHWITYALVEHGNISNTDAKTAVHHRKVGTSY